MSLDAPPPAADDDPKPLGLVPLTAAALRDLRERFDADHEPCAPLEAVGAWLYYNTNYPSAEARRAALSALGLAAVPTPNGGVRVVATPAGPPPAATPAGPPPAPRAVTDAAAVLDSCARQLLAADPQCAQDAALLVKNRLFALMVHHLDVIAAGRVAP